MLVYIEKKYIKFRLGEKYVKFTFKRKCVFIGKRKKHKLAKKVLKSGV